MDTIPCPKCHLTSQTDGSRPCEGSFHAEDCPNATMPTTAMLMAQAADIMRKLMDTPNATAPDPAVTGVLPATSTATVSLAPGEDMLSLPDTPIDLAQAAPLPDNPMDTQVGGDHYTRMAIQPLEYILANDIGFVEGCIIKYVSRWRAKNGVEDLKKALHMLEIAVAHHQGPTSA